MKRIRDLKYLIVTESCSEQVPGAESVHYDVWFREAPKLANHIDSIIDDIEGRFKENSDELKKFHALRNVSAESVDIAALVSNIRIKIDSDVYFTDVYAEGEDIAEAALNFYDKNLSDWVTEKYGVFVEDGDECYEDYECEECEEARRYKEILSILGNVVTNDYDSVTKLLAMISEEIEQKNKDVWNRKFLVHPAN